MGRTREVEVVELSWEKAEVCDTTCGILSFPCLCHGVVC